MESRVFLRRAPVNCIVISRAIQGPTALWTYWVGRRTSDWVGPFPENSPEGNCREPSCCLCWFTVIKEVPLGEVRLTAGLRQTLFPQRFPVRPKVPTSRALIAPRALAPETFPVDQLGGPLTHDPGQGVPLFPLRTCFVHQVFVSIRV